MKKIRVEKDIDDFEEERIRKERYKEKPTKKVLGQIRGFKKILNLYENILPSLRNQVFQNLLKNVKDLKNIHLIDPKKAGEYDNLNLQIFLNKDCKQDVNKKYKTILHEMMHVGTTKIDSSGNIKSVGLEVYDNNIVIGRGLNEGATEYFAQNLYVLTGRPLVRISYYGNVMVINELVLLYGENVILDAMLNGTNNLEQLMAKDGKSYVELRNLMDEYHNELYFNKNGLSMYEAINSETLKDIYIKIKNYIKEIKQNRKKKISFRESLKVDEDYLKNTSTIKELSEFNKKNIAER